MLTIGPGDSFLRRRVPPLRPRLGGNLADVASPSNRLLKATIPAFSKFIGPSCAVKINGRCRYIRYAVTANSEQRTADIRYFHPLHFRKNTRYAILVDDLRAKLHFSRDYIGKASCGKMQLGAFFFFRLYMTLHQLPNNLISFNNESSSKY
jgi:hypothetical protein